MHAGLAQVTNELSGISIGLGPSQVATNVVAERGVDKMQAHGSRQSGVASGHRY